jgi:hypothetical protein
MKTPRFALAALMILCLRPALAQEKPPVPFETKYEVIVPGLVGNSPYILQFTTGGLQLVVRDLIMGQGEARDIPTKARALMELRGGSVITTINGVRTERTQGEIWNISAGDSLSIENPRDVAVIRQMSILQRAVPEVAR